MSLLRWPVLIGIFVTLLSSYLLYTMKKEYDAGVKQAETQAKIREIESVLESTREALDAQRRKEKLKQLSDDAARRRLCELGGAEDCPGSDGKGSLH